MKDSGKLLRYSASAGSGKTHALTGFYLSRVLIDPGAYRRILAVTFTNSAAAEMKSRILSRLDILSSNEAATEAERNEFVAYLCEYFPDLYPDPERAMLAVKKNAPLALKNILQDYSRFTVGTIDSFFQRVIRAFAREMEIPAGYEIELEHGALLSDAVDNILSEVATDSRLRSWISSYVASRLDDNKGWDIRREIMEVAEQIFGENFRQLSSEDKKTISDYEILNDYTEKIFRIRNAFESELRTLAGRGVEIYQGCGLTPDDFLSKTKGGIGEMMRRYSEGIIKTPGSTWVKAAGDGKYLSAGAPQTVVKALQEALTKGLGDIVTAISSLFESRYPLYVSALVQVRTIHIMGILGAISERVRALAQDENIFLLSDSGELINKLIADDDTPFIYEKIGTAYDHYVIDEFQDTSRIQWNNFRPLISETLSRGKDNLVVGDVKQSIYRWRNSDWRIIHSDVTSVFGDETVRTIPLSNNYRSRKNIIKFNNLIFAPAAIPSLCDARLNYDRLKISDIYSGSVQEGTEEKPGGLVKVSLYRKSEDEGWRERVLHDIPVLIEELQDNKYKASEILFLCRTNEEGKSIISSILEHSASCPPEKLARYNFEVTSGESLYLERNPAIILLLSCLRYLVDPSSRINLSQMVRSYILATNGKEDSVYAADGSIVTENPLPEGWEEALNGFRNESLFSATENMIRYFNLGSHSENVAYLSSFQDLVLQYSGRYSSDISSFVSWWESDGYKSTLGQSDRQEAMRVMTIHKAKGLQSRVVIVPFVSWDFSKRGYNRPLLWVTDVPEAFAPMPVVLPELSNRLDESLFAGQAKMERASEWLDGVNLLYVAFTRAADALYIMAPEVTRVSAGGGNADSILNEALKNLPEDFVWQETETVRQFVYGELPAAPETGKEDAMTMKEYYVSELRGTLRLRTGGALPHDELKLAEPGGRAYGIMMHELLGRINTTADIESATGYICDAGLLPLSQRELITSRLRSMLSSDKVREWFDGSSAVKTEATIILPSGAARRPDRVMTKDKSVIVVDYKFGEPSDRHRRQAAGYRELLKQMGYESVKSWLWYVEKDIIEEV
ncbi:MAG: UvrD-helicase domain-containing protein [Bacteroidales bacterium]